MGETIKNYILNNKYEVDRLDYQSSFPRYDFKKEFKNFIPKSGQRVLDAGSGSGLVTRHFAKIHDSTEFLGVDYDSYKVNYANSIASDFHNLEYIQGDLTNFNGHDESFDWAISRYVAEHIPKVKIENYFDSVFKALKPGGKFICVDYDLPLVNIYPQTPLMKKGIDALLALSTLDLEIGKKLPHLFKKAGFKRIKYETEMIPITDEYIDHELELLPVKFDLINKAIKGTFESIEEEQQFKSDYLDSLMSEGTVSFYVKFIVEGIKPFGVM